MAVLRTVQPFSAFVPVALTSAHRWGIEPTQGRGVAQHDLFDGSLVLERRLPVLPAHEMIVAGRPIPHLGNAGIRAWALHEVAGAIMTPNEQGNLGRERFFGDDRPPA
jgi:hypothetical protein